MFQWVFVGYGSQICGFGRARWRRRWFGHGLWVSLLVWLWVMSVTVGVAMCRGCGAEFFCLGCWVAMVVWCLATVVVQCLICGAKLAVLWVAV